MTVQSSSRDCERFAGLYNVTVVLSIFLISCILPAIACGSSSDQRWYRIRSAGVASGRILRFSFGPTTFKAVGALKHCLLLPVKLRMTKLNARKNMALGSTFRCMCNYGFEVYVNMTVSVAWFNFSIFGCMNNLKQTYDSVLKIVAKPGGRGDICPRVQHFEGVN